MFSCQKHTKNISFIQSNPFFSEYLIKNTQPVSGNIVCLLLAEYISFSIILIFKQWSRFFNERARQNPPTSFLSRLRITILCACVKNFVMTRFILSINCCFLIKDTRKTWVFLLALSQRSCIIARINIEKWMLNVQDALFNVQVWYTGERKRTYFLIENTCKCFYLCQLHFMA